MRTNLSIAALMFPIVQAVVFGVAFLLLVASQAPDSLFAPVIGATFAVSAPVALLLAPRLRSRAWRRRRRHPALRLVR